MVSSASSKVPSFTPAPPLTAQASGPPAHQVPRPVGPYVPVPQEDDCGAVTLWRPTVYAPARHEWWVRSAALGLGVALSGTGSVLLAQATLVQTPLGAAALYAYEQVYGAHAGACDPMGTLRDWAVAEGVALGIQVGAVGLIAGGFTLFAYAAH